MKYMLPILSVAFVAILAGVALTENETQPLAGKGVTQGDVVQGGAPGQDLPTSGPDGQELVAQAAQQLLVLPGVEAKTRQRVDIFGQQLVGSGTYLQLARGPRLMLRLDLKLQLGQQAASLLQVSDGHFLWIRRDLPDQKSLSRVNLRKLRAAASQSEVPVPASYWMALGGLPQLLIRLNEHFVFQSPQAITIGKLPVWKLEGRWRPESLAMMLPDRRAAILAGEDVPLEELPSHQPHGVTLILGRDQVIPLFPYGISFYRNEVASQEQGRAARRRSLVTLELFEVRFRSDLTPSDFEYQPGDQEIEEQTDQFVARLDEVMKSRK